ncbi:hypothetical protein PIS_057 [Saccharomonospora phage PIS 136]|nr:hypothetical protein PIS_057 [Saccharomonospora phage PIS 136]
MWCKGATQKKRPDPPKQAEATQAAGQLQTPLGPIVGVIGERPGQQPQRLDSQRDRERVRIIPKHAELTIPRQVTVTIDVLPTAKAGRFQPALMLVEVPASLTAHRRGLHRL